MYTPLLQQPNGRCLAHWTLLASPVRWDFLICWWSTRNFSCGHRPLHCHSGRCPCHLRFTLVQSIFWLVKHNFVCSRNCFLQIPTKAYNFVNCTYSYSSGVRGAAVPVRWTLSASLVRWNFFICWRSERTFSCGHRRFHCHFRRGPCYSRFIAVNTGHLTLKLTIKEKRFITRRKAFSCASYSLQLCKMYILLLELGPRGTVLVAGRCQSVRSSGTSVSADGLKESFCVSTGGSLATSNGVLAMRGPDQLKQICSSKQSLTCVY